MPGTAGGMQRSMVRVVYFATSAGEAAGASRPAAGSQAKRRMAGARASGAAGWRAHACIFTGAAAPAQGSEGGWHGCRCRWCCCAGLGAPAAASHRRLQLLHPGLLGGVGAGPQRDQRHCLLGWAEGGVSGGGAAAAFQPHLEDVGRLLAAHAAATCKKDQAWFEQAGR